MSAHSQVNDESEEEDKKGDIFDSNMLSEQSDLEASVTGDKTIWTKYFSYKERRKKR